MSENVRHAVLALRTLRQPSRTDAAPALPRVAAQVVAAIEDCKRGELFPPFARVHRTGVVLHSRFLAGKLDAAFLAHTLAQPRFKPLSDLFEWLSSWSRAIPARLRNGVPASLLGLGNDKLFRPLTVEVFLTCAAMDAPAQARQIVARRGEQFARSVEIFLERYQRDRKRNRFVEYGWCQPVVGLASAGEETHNGGQRVLCLHLRGGRRLAYKPRPANGEQLFLSEDVRGRPTSIFGFLNAQADAVGAARLPLMRTLGGSGRDRYAYGWQEWIERSSHWGKLASSTVGDLKGTRLPRNHAAAFWRDAGALSATCFGFGVTDLYEGNLIAGRRHGERLTRAYPVDLEMYFNPVQRLYETGLVAGPHGHHHVGFENQARLCSLLGTRVCLIEEGDGVQVCLVRQPWARSQTFNVVGDSQGHSGYAAYLGHYLRGMFDAWTLGCRQRRGLAKFIKRASRSSYRRVCLKPTGRYLPELERNLQGIATKGASVIPFNNDERTQLERLDVPYFYCRASGGSVLYLSPPSKPLRPRRASIASSPEREAAARNAQAIRACSRFELAGIGWALRDAVAHVFDQLETLTFLDAQLGIRIDLDSSSRGQVSFEWREAMHQVTYRWTARRQYLMLERLPAPKADPTPRANSDLRRRLLRLQRLDSSLRDSWARGGFSDDPPKAQLEELMSAAASWLAGVVRKYGWPGRSLVGAAACSAACRLIQHLNGARALQRSCLPLLRRAAQQGEVPWRFVAGLTDTIRVQDGKPQLYGTKFRRNGAMLEPFPIERPESVDRRRREVGLESLKRYAHRLHRLYAGTLRQTA